MSRYASLNNYAAYRDAQDRMADAETADERRDRFAVAPPPGCTVSVEYPPLQPQGFGRVTYVVGKRLSSLPYAEFSDINSAIAEYVQVGLRNGFIRASAMDADGIVCAACEWNANRRQWSGWKIGS
jgi:hypothetical protein